MEYILLFIVFVIICTYIVFMRKIYNNAIKQINDNQYIKMTDVENNIHEIKIMVKDVYKKIDSGYVTPKMEADIKEIKNQLEEIMRKQDERFNSLMIEIGELKQEVHGFDDEENSFHKHYKL